MALEQGRTHLSAGHLARRASLAALLLASVGCHHGASSSSGAGDGGPQESLPPITSATLPVHAAPLTLEAVEAAVNPGKLTPYTGPTGSIEGTIRIDGPPSPDIRENDYSSCPEGSSEYGKLFREGPAGADGSRAVADAIVTVTNYDGFLPERRDAAKLSITGCGFERRTVAMTFGQRLEVSNLTDALWAPTLSGTQMPALMVATAHGDPVRLYPPKPGRFDVSDMMKHSYARADVYVLLQPLHDVSALDGHYRIDGVPVGKVWVAARVPTINQQAALQVEVSPNVVKTVDLVVHYKPQTATTGMPDGGRLPKLLP